MLDDFKKKAMDLIRVHTEPVKVHRGKTVREDLVVKFMDEFAHGITEAMDSAYRAGLADGAEKAGNTARDIDVEALCEGRHKDVYDDIVLSIVENTAASDRQRLVHNIASTLRSEVENTRHALRDGNLDNANKYLTCANSRTLTYAVKNVLRREVKEFKNGIRLEDVAKSMVVAMFGAVNPVYANRWHDTAEDDEPLPGPDWEAFGQAWDNARDKKPQETTADISRDKLDRWNFLATLIQTAIPFTANEKRLVIADNHLCYLADRLSKQIIETAKDIAKTTKDRE